MTNQQILRAAMQQSAIDLSCRAEDFCGKEPVVVHSVENAQARKYLTLPFFCNLVSYGDNVVASINQTIEPAVRDYLSRYAAEHCFETPNLLALDGMLRGYGMRVCFMAEYFLPDLDRLRAQPCRYEVRILDNSALAQLYKPQWGNALCEKRKELDVLAAGAYDAGKLVGLAGCSADCETMWQIGIDVLPQYRRQGIASALTTRLACETLKRGKIPFYCAAWSNVKSVRNAIKCGFLPAWVELSAKPEAFVRSMNGLSHVVTV